MIDRTTGIPVAWWLVIASVAVGIAQFIIRWGLDRRSK